MKPGICKKLNCCCIWKFEEKNHIIIGNKNELEFTLDKKYAYALYVNSYVHMYHTKLCCFRSGNGYAKT
jgi:hypothetical protein